MKNLNCAGFIRKGSKQEFQALKYIQDQNFLRLCSRSPWGTYSVPKTSSCFDSFHTQSVLHEYYLLRSFCCTTLDLLVPSLRIKCLEILLTVILSKIQNYSSKMSCVCPFIKISSCFQIGTTDQFAKLNLTFSSATRYQCIIAYLFH